MVEYVLLSLIMFAIGAVIFLLVYLFGFLLTVISSHSFLLAVFLSILMVTFASTAIFMFNEKFKKEGNKYERKIKVYTKADRAVYRVYGNCCEKSA